MAGGTGTGWLVFGVSVGLVGWGEERTSVIEKNDMATGPSQLLNHFDTLRIIFLHNVLVPITKSLRRPLEEWKPLAVSSVLPSFSLPLRFRISQ